MISLPTHRPPGWRDLLPHEMVEITDWVWISSGVWTGRYIPIFLALSADENSRYIRKMKDVPLKGKW